MQGHISRWGNSLGPKEVANHVGLAEGAQVEIEAHHGEGVIRPLKPRLRNSLEELVAGVTPEEAHASSTEIDWGPDVGAEIVEE
jgi:antitoxin component of MazEF toxin-antitoxin module